jgi:hypothetical protein
MRLFSRRHAILSAAASFFVAGQKRPNTTKPDILRWAQPSTRLLAK